MINYFRAVNQANYALARMLFEEYAALINIDLSFQKFDSELNQLETMYQMPQGGIILAEEEGICRGCVGIRKIDEHTSELKRMFVRSGSQGKGIGKSLLHYAVELAKDCKYEKIQLDTLNTMNEAIHLYKSAGFYQIEAYYPNPMPAALYFEKLL